jgi:hypothetical protein
MKKLILLAVILVACNVVYCITPRQMDNVLMYKFKEPKNKKIEPYGELEYIKTQIYEHGNLNLYRITETNGLKKIIIGFYAYMKGIDNEYYYVVPIFNTVYDENYKLLSQNKLNNLEIYTIIMQEITNQLLKENKLNYHY